MFSRKRILFWVKLLVAIYVVVGVALYFLQDKLLFHPEPLEEGYTYKFDQPFRQLDVPVTDKKNLSIVQFTVPDSVRKGVVLYFHGNMTNINRYAPVAPLFTQNNYEIWMMDYPGFGKTTGNRSEEAMLEDAEVLYDMARLRFPPEKIILYGRSMGSGLATYLASRHSCQQLVLETPYYSMYSLMNHYTKIYPASWLSKYEFPNNKYMTKMIPPVTIFHGTDDEVIPYSQARRLAALSPKARLITIEDGGHNNLAEFEKFRAEVRGLLK